VFTYGAMKFPRIRPRTTFAAAATLSAFAFVGLGPLGSGAVLTDSHNSGSRPLPPAPTTTPIKHVVVIYGENVSFDHYFGTYPAATNTSGSPFQAAPGTPSVNGLNGSLLTANPNGANPRRLDPANINDVLTCDQNHDYTPEQFAFDNGKMDRFTAGSGTATTGGTSPTGQACQASDVMNYYDGNTVTALWHYAQHFAMSDNAYTDTYGPSTPGALEVVSGQTNGMRAVATTKKPFRLGAYSYYIDDGQGGLTMINDVDPAGDVCSKPSDQVLMEGKNIGDLLNAAGITWGGFMGGFNLATTNANGTTGCKRSTHSTVVGANITDYIPHHNWFQYYPSTANPTHARPSSLAAIGYSFDHSGSRDPANHEYGLQDFYNAVKAGNFPAVSYLKLPGYQDGHAGYSDPLDEQAGVVTLVNFLEQQPDWKNTAVIVTWDDSDGWYDHAFATPTNPSFDKEADQLDGPGKCGTGTALPGVAGKPVNGRCGPGTRIPFLVISPWAKANDVSHDRISQASVVRFVEDNWLHGERLGGGSFDATAGSIMSMFDFTSGGKNPPLHLDPATGNVLPTSP
jgi:phospholipase C